MQELREPKGTDGNVTFSFLFHQAAQFVHGCYCRADASEHRAELLRRSSIVTVEGVSFWR